MIFVDIGTLTTGQIAALIMNGDFAAMEQIVNESAAGPRTHHADVVEAALADTA